MAALAIGGCASIAPGNRPPASLAEPCQEPRSALKTNADLASYALDLKAALSGCAAQVDGLRAWLDGSR
jgi:hypothetical protein